MTTTGASPFAADPSHATVSDRPWTRFIPPAAALIIALWFTLDGYTFGRSNQMEQLPALLAYNDRTLLAKDYVIQTFMEGGPRFYFTRLLSFGSQLLPLPALFFSLTLATNAATLWITFGTTWRVFGNLLAAYASLLLVAALQFYVRLGDAGFLLTNYLSPSSLAIPGTLAALSLAARGGHSAQALLWAFATSTMHPLYGIAAAGCVLFLDASRWLQSSARGAESWRALGKLAANGVAFAVGFALLWYRPSAEPRIDDSAYFQIYAQTRGPHHVLPSMFPLDEWVLFGTFSACALICLYVVRAQIRALAPLLWAAALVHLGFVLGYVFVEVIPVRAVMVSQTFRFVCITSWVGILLGAGAFGSIFEAGVSEQTRRWRAGAVALAFSLLVLGERVMHQRRRGITLVLILLLALGCWALHTSRHQRAALLGMLGAVVLVAGLRFGVFRERDLWLGSRWPTFTLDDFETHYDDVAAYARQHTPRDDVFVIADAWSVGDAGTFRCKAERALFVEYKAFPFTDQAIAEWYARVSALRALDLRQNNDARLRDLANRYGLSHAVLPKDMPTELPVEFVGEHRLLVSLASPRP